MSAAGPLSDELGLKLAATVFNMRHGPKSFTLEDQEYTIPQLQAGQQISSTVEYLHLQVQQAGMSDPTTVGSLLSLPTNTTAAAAEACEDLIFQGLILESVQDSSKGKQLHAAQQQQLVGLVKQAYDVIKFCSNLQHQEAAVRVAGKICTGILLSEHGAVDVGGVAKDALSSEQGLPFQTFGPRTLPPLALDWKDEGTLSNDDPDATAPAGAASDTGEWPEWTDETLYEGDAQADIPADAWSLPPPPLRPNTDRPEMWWVLTAATAGVPGEHSSSAAIRAETKFLPMPLSPEDLSTLRPGSRCIDEVVDHWMLLLQRRPPAKEGPVCLYTNTRVDVLMDPEKVSKARTPAWHLVGLAKPKAKAARWSMLQCDRLIIPYHASKCHWAVAVVDVKRRRLLCFDSLQWKHPKLMDALQKWIQDEAKEPRLPPKFAKWLSGKWKIQHPEHVPKQTNDIDCGVFCMMMCDRLGLDKPFDFDQASMKDWRVRIVCDLFTGDLRYTAYTQGP